MDRIASGGKRATGLMIALSIVAVAVVLLAGAGVAWWVLFPNRPVAREQVAKAVAPAVNRPAEGNPVAKGPGFGANEPPPPPPNQPPPPPPPPAVIKVDDRVAPPKPAPAMAGELPKELLEKTTRATAFIRTDLGSRTATGSGFLVKASGDTGYIITNFHVIDLEQQEPPPPSQPFGKGTKSKSGITKAPKGPSMVKKGPLFGGPRGPWSQPANNPEPKLRPKVSVVLHSGTPEEQTLPAEVVAFDEEADLAALRITGARNLPAALDVSQEAPVAQAMPVYIFGFPMGKAPQKAGYPAITIGKGSIGGVRRDANNEIIDININGDLNPGNSGGPVVDADGRLVGVAVAAVLGRQVGFVVPAGDLSQMFKGRIHLGAVFQMKQQGASLSITGEAWVHDRKSTVRERNTITLQVPGDSKKLNIPADQYQIFLRLSDPMLKIKGVNLHFGLTEDVPDKPGAQGWVQLANATSAPLRIQDQNAYGEFKLPAGAFADDTFAFQFSYINAEGQTIHTQPHLVRLTFPKNLKSVTLNIGGIADDSSRRYLEDSMPKWLSGQVVVKSRTRDTLVVEINPVPDVKALLPKITFGQLKAVQGRTLTVAANKLELPLPKAEELKQPLENLTSTDPRKRQVAAEQLGKVYATLPERRAEVAGALEARLFDNDLAAGRAAAQALGLWAGPESVPALIRTLEHKDALMRRTAVEVLGKLKDPTAAPEIAKLLPAGFEREQVSVALKAIGPAAEKAVIPHLTHKDLGIVREACSILKEIGTAECVPALTTVAKSNNAFVSPVAREALKAVQSR
jgi:S1-C subfamily serine protease